MAYKCLDCGHIFEDGEQAFWNEDGEYWGAPFSQRMGGCPICKGAYEETTPCAVCGSEHLEEELNGGACDECIDEYRKDFDACYKIALLDQCEIKINALLASLICETDIEAILVEHIKKNMSDIDCSKYIDIDISWFGEQIAKEVKNNENKKN